MNAPQHWHGGATATSLRSWRGADLAQVAGVVEAAWQAWAREWDVSVDSVAAVVCGSAADTAADSHAWHLLGQRGDARAWVHWSGNEARELARCWFDGDAADTPVIADMVQACMEDARHCLARALRLAESKAEAPPARELFSRWGGGVTASLCWGGLLLLEPGVLDALVTRVRPPHAAPALVGIGKALAGTELALRVDLQGCELALGSLRSLRAGDVLRLPHRVEAPATVVDARGQAVFQGWLARSRGRRAVELAALQAQ